MKITTTIIKNVSTDGDGVVAAMGLHVAGEEVESVGPEAVPDVVSIGDVMVQLLTQIHPPAGGRKLRVRVRLSCVLFWNRVIKNKTVSFS